MNPKGNTRAKYYGTNKPQKDKFKGHKGKIRKQQLYKSKPKNLDLINSEITGLQSRYQNIQAKDIKKFADFPLSKKTLDGLLKAKYTTPTEIQRESIGLALQGNDILGAAKTGSGKTLAFLIPVLECLFRQKWSSIDGLGALIISPTRELAYQTFEVLKRIGKFHDFSAGLVIGGKLLKEETARINRTNIIICTPGRLLQHMDETFNFTADSLQVLVLDEADRILDLGFSRDMNAIIENLPSERQTLLFSATQTKSVKDLARLSLKNPMFVSAHEHSTYSTPSQLEQNYVVCELHDKISMLWSFVKNHLKSKVLVFLASCKQVKFIYEIFRRLRPGVTVLALHGAMNQLKRVDMYNQFCRKQNAVLFATDIAARGLDIPEVNWVIQLDCPENANTYIHRVGRTARYHKDGEALLVLLPSEEEGMIAQLEEKKIPINKIRINPKKLWSIQTKLESLLASDPALKETAQRAFLGYLRSVFLMSNKKVFDVHKLDTEKFSSSLGLAIPPRIRFLKREEKRQAEKEAQKKDSLAKLKRTAEEEEDEEDISGSEEESEESISDFDTDMKITEKKRAEVKHSDEYDSSESESESRGVRTSKKEESLNFDLDDDNSDLFTVKRRVLPDTDSEDEKRDKSVKKEKDKKPLSKFALAKKLQKKNVKVNTKVTFDEEGETVTDVLKKSTVEDEEEEDEGGIDIAAARQRMIEEDKIDKQIYTERIKQKHREERLPGVEKKKLFFWKHNSEQFITYSEHTLSHHHSDEDEMVVQLGGSDEEEGEEDDPLSYIPTPDNSDQSGEESEGEVPSKKRRMVVNSDESSDEEEDNDSEEEEDDMGDSDDESEESNEESEEENEDEIGGENEEDIDTGLSLNDDEAIALKLLQS
ncbi:probable ATP-dependent RNA helicase DDX10 [Saccostrea cucullata]|uniref:probable ATP-dependent RNA helicase DDX10 n=1 Tax=Saccostrea cuccullata TaxID=36930 RepID=UPI002ED09AD6